MQVKGCVAGGLQLLGSSGLSSKPCQRRKYVLAAAGSQPFPRCPRRLKGEARVLQRLRAASAVLVSGLSGTAERRTPGFSSGLSGHSYLAHFCDLNFLEHWVSHNIIMRIKHCYQVKKMIFNSRKK